MSYRMELRSEVYEDLSNAISWYDDKINGLGNRFLDQVNIELQQILENPKIASADKRGVRNIRMRVFPYVIRYIVSIDYITILAIQYGGKDPSSWIERLEIK